MKIIKAKHENGLEGVLYVMKDASALSIFKEGKEIFHTGYTQIASKEELYDELGKVPGFFKDVLHIDLKYL